MAISSGINRRIITKRQTAKGVIATNTGGQIVRRTSGMFDLQKEAYTTEEEITSVRQVLSSRHGVKLVNGKISGILSPGTYSDYLGAVLLRDFAAVTAITGLSITIALAAVVNNVQTYTVTRSAGSWLTDGIKIGYGVRLTAGTFNAGNLNRNMLVIAVTAAALTVIPMNEAVNGVAMVAEGPVASASLTVPGKVSYVPNAGHTNVYYTVEDYFGDLSPAVSKRSIDVKFTKADLNLPGSGNSKIDLTAVGLNQTIASTPYFAAPTSETTTPALAGANGSLVIDGVPQGVITGLQFSIDDSAAPADAVLGSSVRPDIFEGKVKVSGSFTAYYEGGAISSAYINETDVTLISALTGDNSNLADFVTFTLGRVKTSSETINDVETGQVATYNFTAIYDNTGGAALSRHATTVAVHDSAAA